MDGEDPKISGGVSTAAVFRDFMNGGSPTALAGDADIGRDLVETAIRFEVARRLRWKSAEGYTDQQKESEQMAKKAEIQAAEDRGRAWFRAHRDMPSFSERTKDPIRIAEARGWLLEAAKQMPGGWVKEIPPLPLADEQKG